MTRAKNGKLVLKSVFHTGVEVADLEYAISLYSNLGFEVINRFEKPEPKISIAIVSKGDTSFELMQFHDKAHPHVKYIRNHIGFMSDDLEKDVQKFIDDGYKLVIPITEGVIVRNAFVQDSAGTCYEIATQK